MIYLSIAVLYLGCSVLTWGWFLAIAHKYTPGVIGKARWFGSILASSGPYGLFLIISGERYVSGHWPWRHGWRAW